MEIIKVNSVDEALEKVNNGFVPMAGCTNILVDEKKKGDSGKKYVDLTNVRELSGISFSEKGLTFGALTTFADVEAELKDKPEFKALYDAAFTMGGPQIRNRATIAGNIADASPAADSAPALLVLGAKIKLVSVYSERIIDINDFFLGFRKTAIQNNELITEIIVPSDNVKSYYRKIGVRNALAISVVSIAGARNTSGGIKLAMGSSAPTPKRLNSVEKLINGSNCVRKAKLSDALKADISPISDLRASAEYRMAAAENMLVDCLEKEFDYGII